MGTENLLTGVLILEDKALLKVSKDKMEAYVLQQGAEPLSIENWDEVVSAIGAHGIIYGVFASPEPFDGKGWIVARGSKPKDGENASIEFSDSVRHQLVLKEEELSFYTKGVKLKDVFINVQQGFDVAIKNQATQGTHGKNVFKEELAAKPGKDIAIKPGKGVHVSEDGLRLVADVNGRVMIDDSGKISVLDVVEFSESIDIKTTGNVVFLGSALTIRGDILENSQVFCEGNLTVEGNIEEGAQVSCNGMVTVRSIIRGQKTLVKAGAGLHCKVLEYATIDVDGDIVIGENCLDAELKASGSIMATSGKGVISGGHSIAHNTITANQLGMPALSPTVVWAGYHPELRHAHEELIGRLEEKSEKVMEVKAGIKKVDRMQQLSPEDPRYELIKIKLKDAIVSLASEMTAIRERLEDIEKQMTDLSHAYIVVLKDAYPNVTVKIGSVSIDLKSAVSKVKFSYYKGSVVMAPL